jgi:hypothetical protein
MGAARDMFRKSPFDFERWAVSLVNAQPNEKQRGDKGVDGVARFHLDGRPVGRILVSVKGGRTVTPLFVRELIGTIETQKAQMGVLIMMAEPSPGVVDAENHGGTYTWPDNNQAFPRVQVITIQELLAGTRPDMPPTVPRYDIHADRAPSAQPDHVKTDAARTLAERVLVHARPTDAGPVLNLTKGKPSGLVLTGTSGARAASRIRKAAGSDSPILVDPAAYETETATAQEPFRIPEAGQERQALDAFLRKLYPGADAVLTPTRYIAAADEASLKAVIDTAAGLPPWAIISLPLDSAWISSQWIDRLIQMLRGVKTPKAVMIGSAPEGAIERQANLRRLTTEVTSVALFRTDLAAFHGLAHGALAAAIGTSSTLRHVIPPSGRPLAVDRPDEEPDVSPDVLGPDLVAYVRGSTLANLFGDTPGPLCRCRQCEQRHLAGFLGRGDWHDAALHGVAVWTEWLPELLRQPSLSSRQSYWSELCRRGIEEHAVYNRMATDPTVAFTPDPRLLFWADEGPRIAASRHR